ncbi:hypothetical protein [Actinomadura yumaensis]|uniref:Uncharacterized protein n=1 Tax=Actinomadura yumaensis TaxID=111807 RepID=A0ABW2CKM8_9ACTN|nr:hypothetical protein [Actinomadura sp. J1-007]
MGAIGHSPEFSFKNKWRHFTVKDAAGAMVAETVVIEDVEGSKSRLTRFLSNTGDIGRLVLRLSDPAGAPILYLERAGRQIPQFHTREGHPVSPSPIVKAQAITAVAPDASVIGHVEEDEYLFRSTRYGNVPMVLRHKIVVDRQVLCSIVWERRGRKHSQSGYYPSFCDYFTPGGEHLAHFKKGVLRLDEPLPEPLHTLVVISPIAFQIAAPSGRVAG